MAQSRNSPGNVAAFALARHDRQSAELMLLSFWTSLETVAAESRLVDVGDAKPVVHVHAVFDDGRFPATGETAIARVWHGAVPLKKSDAYLALMRRVALADYARTPGNRAAFVLHRVAQGHAHFTMLTFWASRDSIMAFAGSDIDVAKYYDFDRDYLIELEPTVLHYDLVESA